MRLIAYTDYSYRQIDGQTYAERAFALFLDRLAEHFEHLTVAGRLAPPDAAKARYPLSDLVRFVPLPYYESLTEPVGFLRGVAGTLRAFWKMFDDNDAVCLFGPHPLAFPVALMAWARGKTVFLGVRQDTPAYVRSRHPDRPSLHRLAKLMDGGFRLLGRFCRVLAVGPVVADNYRHSRRLLQVAISLVDDNEVVAPDDREVNYAGELTALSVGRLDVEKNPVMMADVLARLLERDPRWRLIVCGEGSLEGALRERLEELEVSDRATLRGYVPLRGGLDRLYRESSVLLHVSWTEGLPQVLYEAFAAALPVVATDVGGIRRAVGDAVTLIPPGDPEAAARALEEITGDDALREWRIRLGNEQVRAATMQVEAARVAAFLQE